MYSAVVFQASLARISSCDKSGGTAIDLQLEHLGHQKLENLVLREAIKKRWLHRGVKELPEH